MKIKTRKIADLIRAEYNPRELTKDQHDKLKDSLKRFGLVDPIIVNTHPERKDILVGGHQRMKVWEELGNDTIPTVEVNLTLDKEKELNVRLNKNTGQFDMEMLQEHFNTDELIEWGFDADELNFFEDTEVIKAEEDDYEMPDEIKTDIVPGDLFEIGEHRLLCGDSTNSDDVEKLMNGEKADMVFTSPPYNGNTGADRDNKSKLKGLYLDNSTDNKSSEEYIQFNADIFNTIRTISADECVVLYNINYNRNSPSEYIDVVNRGRDVFNLVETIVWEKQLAVSLQGDNLTRIYEFIFVLFNGDDKPKMNKGLTECVKNLWKISNIGANTDNHKACFPVELVEKGVNLYSNKDSLLFEPFTGSGTTMVAAHQLKRKCYGMELDPKYCQVIVDRMMKLDSNLVVKRNGKKYQKKELENA